MWQPNINPFCGTQNENSLTNRGCGYCSLNIAPIAGNNSLPIELPELLPGGVMSSRLQATADAAVGREDGHQQRKQQDQEEARRRGE